MIADKDLYISDSLKTKYKSIITKLRHGKVVPGVFVIIRNDNSGDLEVIKSIYFCQKYLHLMALTIVGLTDKYDDAILYLAGTVADEYGVTLTKVKKGEYEFDL